MVLLPKSWTTLYSRALATVEFDKIQMEVRDNSATSFIRWIDIFCRLITDVNDYTSSFGSLYTFGTKDGGPKRHPYAMLLNERSLHFLVLALINAGSLSVPPQRAGDVMRKAQDV